MLRFASLVFFLAVLIDGIQSFASPTARGVRGLLSHSAPERFAWYLSASQGASEPPPFPKSQTNKAVNLFSDKYFYNGDAKRARQDAAARNDFLKTESALDVLTSWTIPADLKPTTIDPVAFRSYIESFRLANEDVQETIKKQGLDDAPKRVIPTVHSPGKTKRPLLLDPANTRAVDFFANQYFYSKRVDPMDPFLVRQRRKVFGEKSVLEVLRPLKSKEALKEFFCVVIIDWENVVDYTDLLPIEDKLDKQIVCLSNAREWKVLQTEFVELESSKQMVRDVLPPSPTKDNRNEPLCYVLGSSGSGKTFFALKHAAPIGQWKSTKTRDTTIYIHAPRIPVLLDPKVDDSKKAKQLIDHIRKELFTTYEKEIPEKLDMHVTLVLDEAGSRDLHGFFNKRENVDNVVRGLRKLGNTVWLVLSGTGLTGAEYSSINDVYKFRMKEWGERELEAVLSSVVAS
jgi:hypothetical protein